MANESVAGQCAIERYVGTRGEGMEKRENPDVIVKA